MSQVETSLNGHAMPHWTDGLSDEQIAKVEHLAVLPAHQRDGERETVKESWGAKISLKALDELVNDARKEANGKGQDDADELSQKERLIRIGLEAELWHDADGNAFASVTVDRHRENFPIKGRKFREWLTGEYGEQCQLSIDGRQCPMAPAAQSLTEAIAALSAKAVRGEEHQPAVRVGEHEGLTYIDLGTPDWSAVKVSAGGWSIVAAPPVRFLRPSGLRPLPVPVRAPRGANADTLAFFLNVGDNDLILIVAALVSYLRAQGPYPILSINGASGAAKSTICKVVRALIDPNLAPLRSTPKSEDDLMIAGKNGWVIAFDNMSYIKNDLSDALCRISTGAGWGKRKLYEDDEEVLICVCRPIILNGIPPSLITRADLATRAITIEARTMDPSKQLEEKEFWPRFEAAAPHLFAFLLGTLSGAMRLYPTVELQHKPRMADFARLGEAACRAVGAPAGRFEKAYAENRGAAVDAVIDADPVAQAVIDWITRELSNPIGKALWARDGQTGRRIRNGVTATKLLELLIGELQTKLAGDGRLVPILPEHWPKDSTRLSGALTRAKPALRDRGIELEAWRETTTKKRERMITIAVPESWAQS
jgi:hypothetical protein